MCRRSCTRSGSSPRFHSSCVQTFWGTRSRLPQRSRTWPPHPLPCGSARPQSKSRVELGLLTQIASQLAISLEHARAYREITELKNKLKEEKLYFEDEIRTELNFEEIN